MKKEFKVFAADIDGTLALKGESLMPLTKKGLNELHKNGVLIGIASGRPLDSHTINKAKDWGLDFEFDYAIGMNGGDLYTKDDGKIHRLNYLKPHTIKSILEMIWDLDINAIVYKDAYSDIMAKRIDDFLRDSQKRNNSKVTEGTIDQMSMTPTGKIEVHMKHKDLDEMLRRIEKNKSDEWTYVKTFEMTPEMASFMPEELRKEFGDHITLEFQDPRVNKGDALLRYLEMKNIKVEDSLAFGDMENDIGLLKEAGWGVCMLNGCADSKAVAKDVTEYPCAEDGVGHYLFDHII